MGQAKQRGTYEQRKEQAINRQVAKEQWLAKREELKPKQKSPSVNTKFNGISSLNPTSHHRTSNIRRSIMLSAGLVTIMGNNHGK